MPPHLSLDGCSKEYDFPDLTIGCPEIIVESNIFDGLNVDNGGIDIKEMENMTTEIDNLKCKMLSKDSSIGLLKNRLESKDEES
jgi:hypothetical protein